MVRRLALVCVMGCGVGWAQQQPIGTVGMQDATVVGALEVSNGRATLVGNTTVTARDHAAEIALSRGGLVRVCATSGLHAASGKGSAGAAQMPLMLALDRGAIEIQAAGTTSDVVVTPDLRFTLQGNGPLDLQLRVTRNGDTCVENRGAKAPTLHVAEQFGDAIYELHAGQHVMFEHGSLKEVVDHESSSCGCPPEPSMTVADALVNSGAAGAASPTGAAKTAAEEHPFPAAVSAGLAPATSTPQTPTGTIHSQVSATLSTNGPDSTSEPNPAPGAQTAGNTASSSAANGGGSASAEQGAGPVSGPGAAGSQPPPPHGGLLHSVGHFFRRIFGGG
jgi:hypothetical protein